MNFEDILYFDYKSGDDITLNLNFVGRFLWYAVIEGPVTFKFAHGHLDIIYKNFLLRMTKTGVTIYSDFKQVRTRKEAPRSLTIFEITEEEAIAVWQGIENLLRSYPKKSLGKGTFRFDPAVLRA